MQNTFRDIADRTAAIVGSPWTFVGSVAVTALWLILGPVFRFSDTWQLTMNTLASQATFLVAFLLQNTQNRDTRALQLKLDELIRSTTGARDHLVRLEDMSDGDLDRLQEEFEALKRQRSARPLEHSVGGVPGPDARQHLGIGGDLGVTETAIEMTLMGCGEDGVEAAVEEERDGVVQEAVVPLIRCLDAPGLRDARDRHALAVNGIQQDTAGRV